MNESMRKIVEKFQGQKITVNDIKKKLIQLGLDSKIINSFKL